MFIFNALGNVYRYLKATSI